MNVQNLISIGGKEWVKDDMHRIYFNADVTAPLIGLEIVSYKTGNIESAFLNGEKISNNKARQIMTTLDIGKVYFDVAKGEFVSKGMGALAEKVIDAIKKAAQ